MKKITLINSRMVFTATIIVVPTLALLVYFAGRKDHRSLYVNSLLSTTIISAVFLFFIFIGLYNGWKLKDDLGNLMTRFDRLERPANMQVRIPDFDFGDALDIGEAGPVGCLFSFVIWIIAGLFGAIILWTIGAFFWGILLLGAGVLYWVIFRAYRLIFKNSGRCKGNFLKSFATAALFTILYNCWIYVLIFGAHYLASF